MLLALAALSLAEIFFGAVFIILLLLMLFADNKSWAAWLTIGAGGLLAWYGWEPAKAYFSQPGAVAGVLWFCGGWLLVGFLFSFIKWYVYTRKFARMFRDTIEGLIERARFWNKEASLDEQREKALEVFNESTRMRGFLYVKLVDGSYDVDYSAAKLSQYVTAWTIYWPFYALLIVLEDLLRELFDWLTRVFGKTFRRMASHAFAGIK